MATNKELELLELEHAGTNLNVAAEVATHSEHDMSMIQAFKRYPMASLWAISLSFAIVMEGYDSFLMPNLVAAPQFAQKYGSYYPELQQTVIGGPWQVALNVCGQCGAFVGLILNGYLMEKFGHRLVTMVNLIALSAFVFITFFAPNVQVLVVGQTLCGLTWGPFAVLGPAYASEVTPLALRGFLTSFTSLCWIIGNFLSAGVLQAYVSNLSEWSFRAPLALQWLWPLPLFILAYLAPDSPWWLIRKGRLLDAEKSLHRLARNLAPEEARLRLAMMVHTNNLEKETNRETSIWECFRGSNYRRTEACAMVLTTQSLCGQAFAYASIYFLVAAGLDADSSFKLGLGSQAIGFVATCCSWLLMTKFGRRPMIITGLSAMTIILLIVAAIDYPARNNPNIIWAQGSLLIIWLGLYALTVGPQSWALASEVSATRLRSQTLSICRNVYNLAFVVTLTVEPYLINPTEANLKGKTGFVWMGTSILCLLWCVFRLPETKDLTYEELDILFEQRVPAWRFTKARSQFEHQSPAVVQEDN